VERHLRGPLHHLAAQGGPSPPLPRGRKASNPVLAARFLRPRFVARQETKASRTNKGEAERRKAHTEAALAHKRSAACIALIAARAAFGGRARLPALYRGSCQRPLGLRLSPVSRFMVADNRSAPRAASSWQTRVGGPGEFPNRPRMELRAPSRAPLPLASIGRHRLTSLTTSRIRNLVSEKRTSCQDQSDIKSRKARRRSAPAYSRNRGRRGTRAVRPAARSMSAIAVSDRIADIQKRTKSAKTCREQMQEKCTVSSIHLPMRCPSYKCSPRGALPSKNVMLGDLRRAEVFRWAP